MFTPKYKANFRITSEMLSQLLFGKHVNIETIEFDKGREILNVYISGDELKEFKHRFAMAEGDEHPYVKVIKNEDGTFKFC